ncbi:MAG: hypothetical protein D6698_01455 [Gammaproteobacteria bacterium]|nr:MAG: hypothetical protein D6698_01455 [Gammaproteobacteria bacterium]
MLKPLYRLVINYPRLILVVVLAITVFMAMQLKSLRWETDARVYLPKGHPAITYDEKVIELFGVKDSVIIAVANDKGIFNRETLQRVKRITEKVANLPGVIAQRTIDVASLSTAELFVGDDESMGAQALMPEVPDDEAGIQRLKKMVYDNADLFVGNLVSKDGKATMIRAKLKEGATNRYQTYFQIKGILQAEKAGGKQDGQGWNADADWNGAAGQKQWKQGDWKKQGGWSNSWKDTPVYTELKNGDRLYLAGRPVIEVTSGLQAMDDMKLMIPVLILVIGFVLLLFFRTLRGVALPLFVMLGGIIWTLGTMVLLGYPLYTISTMLPVILVAVGIGDSVHLMSHYYDRVLPDPHRKSSEIVTEVMDNLGPPLITTTLTTAAGFLSLLFAEMPPFRIFGVFAVLGIVYCWLLSVTFLPAALTVLRPKVGGYLKKRRSMRLHAEQDGISRVLVALGENVHANRSRYLIGLVALSLLMVAGSMKLHVDSSWMSDFRNDSEVAVSNNLLNRQFNGTIFLNVVIESDQKGALKSPAILRTIETLQTEVEKLPYVGKTLSIVDFIKSANKTLHEGDPAYKILPASSKEMAEYLYLLSLSGRPEQLDQVIDYDYRRTLLTIPIQTDHTRILKNVIDHVNAFVKEHFRNTSVHVNLAGSANNSYIWADLLIGSQTSAIMVSKLGIFILATILFMSLMYGFFVVLPVTLATLLISGGAGWLGIPLDVSTTLAAGVAIGVGVDYAVHYMFRFRDCLAVSEDALQANLQTLRTVGKTIVINATIVTAGFSVLLFSRFPPHVKMGYFVSIYMVVSCLAAIIVLSLCLSSRPAAKEALVADAG